MRFRAICRSTATLIEGAIDDLNVMTRRGRYRHVLSRWRINAPIALPRHGDTLIVLTRRHAAVIQVGAESAQLAPGDAVVLDDRDPAQIGLDPDGSGDYFAIDLWRTG